MKNIQNSHFESLLSQISSLIDQSKKNLQSTINTAIIDLYWNIGKLIQIDVLQNKKAGYGESIIEELGISLTTEYGRGFGSKNIFHMVNFYNTFSDENIFYIVCRKLSWSHLRWIIYLEEGDNNA